MASDHTANLLGALSLSLNDRMTALMAERAGHSETAAAAISALDQFLDECSLDRLSRVVGLSQSGGVRMVDRLQADGLVTRRTGDDGRERLVSLTARGRRTARRLAETRMELLRELVTSIAPDDQDQLDALISSLLVNLMRGPGATKWMCRLCDLTACGRADGHCPLERAARARRATTSTP